MVLVNTGNGHHWFMEDWEGSWVTVEDEYSGVGFIPPDPEDWNQGSIRDEEIPSFLEWLAKRNKLAEERPKT